MAWISNAVREKLAELQEHSLVEIADQFLELENMLDERKREIEDLQSEITDLKGQLAEAVRSNG